MLTQLKIKQHLHYTPKTGVFIRLKTGEVAGGARKDGYHRISIHNKRYYAHRLAWLYEYGYMPKQIDHIDHNPSNNKISNLREATQKENQKNMSKGKNNTSGVVGVGWHKKSKRWRAYICVDGSNISLGYFTLFHEAVNARKNAEVLYGFHENHGKDL